MASSLFGANPPAAGSTPFSSTSSCQSKVTPLNCFTFSIGLSISTIFVFSLSSDAYAVTSAVDAIEPFT